MVRKSFWLLGILSLACFHAAGVFADDPNEENDHGLVGIVMEGKRPKILKKKTPVITDDDINELDSELGSDGVQVNKKKKAKKTDDIADNDDKSKSGDADRAKPEGKIDQVKEGIAEGIMTLKDKLAGAIEGEDESPKAKRKRMRPDKRADYPDPLFYEPDALMEYKPKFETAAFVYNDKSNKENLHIPRHLPSSLVPALFKLVREHDLYYRFEQIIRTAGDKNDELNLNERDRYGNTLLIFAVRYDNVRAVRLLLSYGADPNICNSSQVCPLHIAVFNNKIDVARPLLDSSADMRTPMRKDVTVMNFAISNGLDDMIRTLMETYLRRDYSERERVAIMAFAASNGKGGAREIVEGYLGQQSAMRPYK